jgi:DHA1 family tetracycline resistance protein-like MFS transporter
MKFHVQYPSLMPLWLAVYIDVLGFSILIPFLPFFAAEYSVSALVVGLLLSANAVFGLVFGPIWGWLSDKYGRKPFLLLSMAGTCVGFLILAFSSSLEMLFLSRIVDGLFGGVFPITKAVIGDIVPPKGRSEQMSNVGVMFILANLIGPGVGGALSRWGIIAPGLLAALLTAISFILTQLYVKESLPTKFTGGESLTNVVEEKPPTDILGKVYRASLWRNRSVIFLLVQWGFHTFMFATYVSCISIFGGTVLGLTAEEMGYLLMLAGIIRVFVRFVIFVPLLNKLGDSKTAILGLGVFIGVFIVLIFVGEPGLFSVVLIGTSFAASCTRGPLSGFQSRAVSKRDQGKMMGYSTSVENVSNIFGPIFGGFLLSTYASGWYGAALAMIAAIPFTMGFRKLDLMQDREASTKKLSEAEIG